MRSNPLPNIAIVIPLLSLGTMSAINAFPAGIRKALARAREVSTKRTSNNPFENGKIRQELPKERVQQQQ